MFLRVLCSFCVWFMFGFALCFFWKIRLPVLFILLCIYICFMYYIYERLLYILSLLFKSFTLDFLCLGFCKFWLVLSLLFIRVVFILFLQFHLCYPACLFSLCRLVITCSVFFISCFISVEICLSHLCHIFHEAACSLEVVSCAS